MKKIFTCFLSALVAVSAVAQCTSSASSYDLVVTGNVVLPPTGPQFTFGYVCSGGNLFDSTTCCTRFIHVEAGGTYEAGPAAYGMVYLKSGATFDAHGNSNFFLVDYEAGAIILNYTGPMTLCSTVTFPSANCASAIEEEQSINATQAFPNPVSGKLTIRLAEKINGVGEVIIINALGEKVLSTQIDNFSSTVPVDVSALKPALYFYSVVQLGSVISSGKIMVSEY
jgi:hypothetical protein